MCATKTCLTEKLSFSILNNGRSVTINLSFKFGPSSMISSIMYPDNAWTICATQHFFLAISVWRNKLHDWSKKLDGLVEILCWLSKVYNPLEIRFDSLFNSTKVGFWHSPLHLLTQYLFFAQARYFLFTTTQIKLLVLTYLGRCTSFFSSGNNIWSD